MDFPDDAGLVGVFGFEFGEVDLGLLSGPGLEAPLEPGRRVRPGRAEMGGHRGLAAFVAALPDLPEQPASGQIRAVSDLFRDQHCAGHKPDPGNGPQDGDGFRQGSVGVEAGLDPLLQVLDAPVQHLPEIGVDVFELAGGSVLLVGLAMQRMALAHLDKLPALGRRRPGIVQLPARQPASGRNAMNRAISSASIRSVLAKVPRLLPNASACAGASCRASIPAASRRSQRRHSWPPVASKQTKASLSPAIFASSEWPSSVFRRRSWRPSLTQCKSSQSRETSKPMISGCVAVFILSSFRFAVPDGRNQLFEAMKRGGAGLLESVAEPQV